jgi:hypothetical protein
MRLRPILVTAVAVAAAAVTTAVPAQAAAPPIVQGLAGPLSLSVDHGKLFVAQSFGGKLTRYRTDGSGAHDLVTKNPAIEIGAVEAAGPGTLFALTGKNKAGKFARLVHLAGDGTTTTRADLRGFEKTNNPDKNVQYGFRDLSASCAKKVPKEAGGGDPQPGIVDSHPYATALLPSGAVLVADAAGNDLLRVSKSGQTRVVALLPPQPTKITKALAASQHLPKCTAGHTYWFEPVPTDVEVRGHVAYLSLLPGGPEDPSLGARGKVYTVNLLTGAVTQIGRNFLGATGVAVSPTGKVYVSELFGNRISTIRNGKRHKVFSVVQPSALEWHNGHLFATTNTFTNGSIEKFTP